MVKSGKKRESSVGKADVAANARTGVLMMKLSCNDKGHVSGRGDAEGNEQEDV